MSSALPSSSGCCSACGTPPATTNIPGPQGAAGHNAFSTLTASFTVPAVNSTVVINLADNAFTATGQTLLIAGAGYYQVTSVGAGGNVTVKNLGVSGNASPGATIPSTSAVTPAGAQGDPGTLDTIAPTTTKGDLMVDDGTGGGSASIARFPAGTNNYVLHADSTQSKGLRYDQLDLSGSGTSLKNSLPIGKGGTGNTTQQAALNALMPSVPVKGDLCAYNGTNWVRLPITVTTGIRQMLRINAAGDNIEYAYQGIIQRLVANYTTYNSTGNFATIGNTLPVAGNGKLIITQAITPVSNATKIKVRASAPIFTGLEGGFLAIFNGSTCVAMAATNQASILTQLACEYQFAPGSTSTITFNVYFGSLYTGSGSTGTAYVNGNASAALWGGAAISMLTVEEYAQ